MRVSLRVVTPATAGFAGVVLLCTAVLGTQNSQPQATTIVVSNTNDSGLGSLRLALSDANDGDTIVFDPALNGQTILLTSAELAINKNITINGPGANLLSVARSTATGTPQFRIFHILPNHTVAIENITISGGNLFTGSGSGGGLFNDQAILTIDHCTVSNNQVSYTGAGIDNTGTLNIGHSLITNNTATDKSGGISNDAGGLLTIADSTVSNNTSTGSNHLGLGGGIYHVSSQTLTIRNTHIDGNHANGDGNQNSTGGGIFSTGPMEIVDSTINSNSALSNAGGIYQTGTTTITRSTISQNWAIYYGGGIYNNAATLTITDSTVSGNNAGVNVFVLGFGGGIYHSGGTLTILNSTINDNRAESGGGQGSEGGGIYSWAFGGLSISNSTFSGNFARINGGAIWNQSNPLTITNCTFSNNTSNGPGGGIISGGNNVLFRIGNTILKAGISGANIVSSGTGTITSSGYNLSSDNGGGFLTAPGDQINTDPMLGPLQDNGGPTFTDDLLPGSPAINAGDPNFTPPPFTDQRGYVRVYNGRIDIGSVEMQPTPITISGITSYCSNPNSDPVPNVTLTLTGSASVTIFSDSLGNYVFSVPSGGNYTVTPSKAPLLSASNGINTIDVVAVQRHFLHIGTPLSGCPLIAADVNADTMINTVDVIAIQRFFLALSSGTANVGNYQFIPTNRTYQNITINQSSQNYDALVFGDVASPFVH